MAANQDLPTFDQARKFAELIGISNNCAWAKFCEGKTRAELFEQVISTVNHRVIEMSLEEYNDVD